MTSYSVYSFDRSAACWQHGALAPPTSSKPSGVGDAMTMAGVDQPSGRLLIKLPTVVVVVVAWATLRRADLLYAPPALARQTDTPRRRARGLGLLVGRDGPD